MENTPDVGGYVIAWLVSVACFSAAVAIGGLIDGGDVVTAIDVLVIYGEIILMFSLPFACVGIVLVHLLCRRIPAQSVHVAAAGLVGVMPALAFATLGWDGGFVAWLSGIPVATAIGRWSVVPLVWRRRRALSRPALAAS
ncbi:MAG: hypothetical protein FWE71_15775 [Nocardioidaceae bacterium]|nr:hypothetical protein [Nocardioidaceae bacterium]MCL2614601.1 hypothetical protein [Nocardioidaceae bacterium]